ncbi:MAG TPA: FMN-binding protein [bacterium]|nr:FMN-binding protein [bacterium]
MPRPRNIPSRPSLFRILPLLAAGTILLSGCKEAEILGGPVQSGRLTDGVFEGTAGSGPNKAAVRVTVEDRRITRVEILSHDAWKGRKAEPVIPGRIVQAQSTNVEAVTGATNSSRVIMNAVQDAVEKACSSDPSPKE